MKRFSIIITLILFSSILESCTRNGDADSARLQKESRGSFELEGISRSYRIHIPPSYERTTSVPLLLVFHGLGGNGKDMERGTKFNGLSDRMGFIVVYPDGYKASWADGSGVTPAGRAGVDDVGFISALIDKLAGELRINPKHVYATGYSNGGMFVQRLACELSDRIAAIASVAGTMTEKLSPKCSPDGAVSVMHIHGTDDFVVPWEGGEVRGVGIFGWNILSVPTTVSKWVDINGCSESSVENYKIGDNKNAYGKVYNSCRDNTEVILYGVVGAGHNFHGLMEEIKLVELSSTKPDSVIQGEEAIWDFFEKHSRD